MIDTSLIMKSYMMVSFIWVVVLLGKLLVLIYKTVEIKIVLPHPVSYTHLTLPTILLV